MMSWHRFSSFGPLMGQDVLEYLMRNVPPPGQPEWIKRHFGRRVYSLECSVTGGTFQLLQFFAIIDGFPVALKQTLTLPEKTSDIVLEVLPPAAGTDTEEGQSRPVLLEPQVRIAPGSPAGEGKHLVIARVNWNDDKKEFQLDPWVWPEELYCIASNSWSLSAFERLQSLLPSDECPAFALSAPLEEPWREILRWLLEYLRGRAAYEDFLYVHRAASTPERVRRVVQLLEDGALLPRNITYRDQSYSLRKVCSPFQRSRTFEASQVDALATLEPVGACHQANYMSGHLRQGDTVFHFTAPVNARGPFPLGSVRGDIPFHVTIDNAQTGSFFRLALYERVLSK